MIEYIGSALLPERGLQSRDRPFVAKLRMNALRQGQRSLQVFASFVWSFRLQQKKSEGRLSLKCRRSNRNSEPRF